MRLDKFLKVSRLIKRRPLAKSFCDAGRIQLNGRTAKAGSEVKPGDLLEINFGGRISKFRIENTAESSFREAAKEMYSQAEE